MEESINIINSKYENQIKEDHYSGKSIVNKIVSSLILIGVVIALIVFYKAFAPSAYDAELYAYSVDLSTMRDVSLDEEKCTLFLEAINKLPDDNTIINSELHSYVDGWNGYKTETITIRENSICSKDILIKVGLKTQKSNGYDILYKNEYKLTGLNRLYESATGYVGICNFIVDSEKLGKLNMTAHIYTDKYMKRLAEVFVGKSLSTGVNVYKKYNTYNLDSLVNRQSINGLVESE